MTGLTASAKRPLFHAAAEYAAGTAGAAFTAGAWRTRPINTVRVNEISGASLGSNQITLPPGDYEIIARTTCYVVENNSLRLYDATGAAVLLIGSTADAASASGSDFETCLTGRFILSAPSALELQGFCATTGTFGNAAGGTTGQVEVYADVLIWKVG